MSIKKYLYSFSYLFILFALNPSLSIAGGFIELSPGMISIDTPSETTTPFVVDFRLGYEFSGEHQIELAIMRSIKENSLNQLTVDVPSIQSIFYRYFSASQGRLKAHFILGVSQIDVDSSVLGISDSSDRFEGVSFGFGFEEAFKSIPALKIKLDWIRLYHGDQLNINATSLGLRYEF